MKHFALALLLALTTLSAHAGVLTDATGTVYDSLIPKLKEEFQIAGREEKGFFGGAGRINWRSQSFAIFAGRDAKQVANLEIVEKVYSKRGRTFTRIVVEITPATGTQVNPERFRNAFEAAVNSAARQNSRIQEAILYSHKILRDGGTRVRLDPTLITAGDMNAFVNRVIRNMM